jgi:hypothetical protein
MVSNIKLELKKYMPLKKFSMLILIFLIPAIFSFVNLAFFTNTTTSAQMDTLIDSLVAVSLLFATLATMVYSNSYAKEDKNNFIYYIGYRTNLRKYILNKVIVNSILTFLCMFIAMLIVFIFVFYLEPTFGFMYYQSNTSGGQGYIPEHLAHVVRNIDLWSIIIINYNLPTYILAHTSFLALNAVLYANIALILTFYIKNTFLALSIPTVLYISGHIFTSYLGFFFTPTSFWAHELSPLQTLFVPSLGVAQWWVILPSFITLIIINIVLLSHAMLIKFKSGDYFA